MKIKANIIKGFIERVYLGGIFNQLIFDFTEEGLKVGIKTESNSIRGFGFLDKNNFEDYVVLGKIGIMDIDILLRIFSQYFNKKVKLDFKKDDKGIKYNNLIISSGENYFKHYLIDFEILKDYEIGIDRINEIQFEEELVIDNSNKLKEILSAVSILDCYNLNLNIKENKLKIIIKEGNNKFIFKKTYELNNNVNSNYSLNFNRDFLKLIKILEDKIIIRLHNETSIVISNENRYGNFKYAFANEINESAVIQELLSKSNKNEIKPLVENEY